MDLIETKKFANVEAKVEPTALGVIVTTGRNTYLGGMASSIVAQTTETSFDRGISQFTWLMLKFMAVMVHPVFGDVNELVAKATALGYDVSQLGTEHRPTFHMWRDA